MNEEVLNSMVEEWIYSASDLAEFYERYDLKEEYKEQLSKQYPPENYETAYEFFYK
jgi:hypothetical protein